jgi:nucleoside-diphosphate-sugar epimerase
VRTLVARGDDVQVISREVPRIRAPGATFHSLDLITDRDATRELVCELQPERLLHLAWTTSPGEYWTSMDNLDWVGASLSLFRAFTEAGGRRAVMAGSCAEYDWSREVLDEVDTPTHPATLYGTAKHSLRLVVEAAARNSGVSLCWGRLFFLYGPEEAPGRLVSSVLDALRLGEVAPVSEGRQERDFLHVDDAAVAFVELLDASVVGPVNVGSGVGVSVREVVATLADLVGRPDLVRYGTRPTPASEPDRLVADVRRLHATTNFRPEFDLRSGLIDTLTRTPAPHV